MSIKLSAYQKYCIEHSARFGYPAWKLVRTGNIDVFGYEIANLRLKGKSTGVTYELSILDDNVLFTIYQHFKEGRKSDLVPHGEQQHQKELEEVQRNLRELADELFFNMGFDDYFGALAVRAGIKGKIGEKYVYFTSYKSGDLELPLYGPVIPKPYYVYGLFDWYREYMYTYKRDGLETSKEKMELFKNLFIAAQKETATRDRNRLRTLKNTIQISDRIFEKKFENQSQDEN